MPDTLQDQKSKQPPRGAGFGPQPTIRARVIQTDRQARLVDRLFKGGLLLAIVLLLGLSGFMQRRLNVARESLGLTRVSPLQNAPPVLAFTTVALGGFRGLIANMLWLRASELQDEDKFFEMAQLADWITKLEPHYPQVWLVQGWNMAYNISVKFKESAPGQFPDRWRWVYGGIK